MTIKLLSIDEAAARCCLPKQTLYQYRSRRKGPPSFKLGVRIVYREDELEAWIEQQQARDALNQERAALEELRAAR